ncbi:MAG: diguanylate cyclase [Geobacteraceae bacterium GWC2_58_44]|nr:MAG: diguanylate cyclase [Geobacteraceae bacterium GWC2_58_44]HBG06871.1 diguanylate cyclase [Geobacter sp.]
MAAATDTPLYNSRIFDSYLKLLSKRYPHVDVSEVLRHAGMKPCEISDQGHWFSQRQVDLFHEKLVQVTGDPGIAREAGRYAASPDALGPLRAFLVGLVSPEYVFVTISRLAETLSRSSRCSSRRVGPRELELTVTFEEGVRENPRQCENRIGFIEAVFLAYERGIPEIRHTECIFTGGEVCRYLIRWQPTLTSRLLLARRVSFFLLAPSAVAIAYRSPDLYLGPLFLCALLLYLGLVFLVEKQERKSLLSSLTSMRSSSERLLRQVQGNYDTALMINEIGEVISKKIELDEIVSSVNQVLQKRLDYGRGMILLADRDGGSLVVKGSFGSSAEAERTLEQLEYPLEGSGSRGILVRCFQTQEPLLVNRLADVQDLARPANYAFFAGLGVNSFICVPIVCEGESLGVLAVDDAKREGELLQSDLNLIQGVAQVIGIAVRNSMRLTNERNLSEKLRRGAEQLERRVAERTLQLSQGQEELEFLYDSVSHDLRTPLRVIYGYGELLLEGYSHLLDQTAKEYLDCMVRGGEQMEATLDRMLDFSEVRLMELKLQPVDLSAIATRILSDLAVTDKRRAVSMQVQEGVVVTGDEKLLKSVMENLIGNAWKYSAGKPESAISFGMQEGVCYVSDNGDGFDMALAERLFRPFQRLHHCNTFAGHGLGLALVHRIIERLGGRVWGAGKPGEGATFYFTVCGEPVPGDELPPSP